MAWNTKKVLNWPYQIEKDFTKKDGIQVELILHTLNEFNYRISQGNEKTWIRL